MMNGISLIYYLNIYLAILGRMRNYIVSIGCYLNNVSNFQHILLLYFKSIIIQN
jgi:hypothetical protein